MTTNQLPRINGHQMQTVDGGLEVTIDGTTYRIVGGGREWVLSIRYGSHFLPLATFRTRKAAAAEAAMRTFNLPA